MFNFIALIFAFSFYKIMPDIMSISLLFVKDQWGLFRHITGCIYSKFTDYERSFWKIC